MPIQKSESRLIRLLLAGLLLINAGCDDEPSSGSGDRALIEPANGSDLLAAAVSTGDLLWAYSAHSRPVLSEAGGFVGWTFDLPLDPCDSGTAVVTGDASKGAVELSDCAYTWGGPTLGTWSAIANGIIRFEENEDGYAVTLESYHSVADSFFTSVPEMGIIDVIELALQCDADKRNCWVRSARFIGRDERVYSIGEPSMGLDDFVPTIEAVEIHDPEHGWFTASTISYTTLIVEFCRDLPPIIGPEVVLTLRGGGGAQATVERTWCGDYEFCFGQHCHTIAQP